MQVVLFILFFFISNPTQKTPIIGHLLVNTDGSVNVNVEVIKAAVA